jgi:hypothetical protein
MRSRRLMLASANLDIRRPGEPCVAGDALKRGALESQNDRGPKLEGTLGIAEMLDHSEHFVELPKTVIRFLSSERLFVRDQDGGGRLALAVFPRFVSHRRASLALRLAHSPSRE